MSQNQFDILKRALEREKAARKQAEKILEKKAAELYQLSQQLKHSNTELEKLVKEKTSELKGVFENIIDAYVVIDLWGNVLKMNEPAIDLLGFDNSNEEINLLGLVDILELDKVKEAFQLLLQEEHVTNLEIIINTKLNEQKLVHINASIITDENNKPIAAQGIVRDITKQKADEEQLIESENRLSTLILNLESAVILEDENRKITLTNKKYTELFNIDITPDELKGMDYKIASEQNSVLFKNPKAFLDRTRAIDEKKETILGDELEMIDGKILERNYVPIVLEDQSKGFLWTFKDVTLNRTYRKRLENEKQKYYNIISNMNLGLVEVDPEDEILMVNQSFIEMTGYSEEELIGIKGKEVLPILEDRDLMKQKVIDRKKGKTESYELRIRNKQGDIKYWLVSGAPNYDLNGNNIGSIGINFDITEIKNLELQKENLLKKLEKSNEELHEYAHVVSHDLKSPLRSINALVSWIKADNKDKIDETSLQNFAYIETTLEKMEQLITDVLEYSSIGSDDTEKREVDINLVVNDLIKILYIPDHVKVNILNTLPTIKGHKTKLQQVFQNLISNAIKFLDKEVGVIDINVEELNTHYKFSIKDNGIGIDKKFHDKIFKIFHALNKNKDSTGIGLSIVKKIIELHEGDIWLESEPTVGTTFYFTLKK